MDCCRPSTSAPANGACRSVGRRWRPQRQGEPHLRGAAALPQIGPNARRARCQPQIWAGLMERGIRGRLVALGPAQRRRIRRQPDYPAPGRHRLDHRLSDELLAAQRRGELKGLRAGRPSTSLIPSSRRGRRSFPERSRRRQVDLAERPLPSSTGRAAGRQDLLMGWPPGRRPSSPIPRFPQSPILGVVIGPWGTAYVWGPRGVGPCGAGRPRHELAADDDRGRRAVGAVLADDHRPPSCCCSRWWTRAPIR